MDPQPAQKGQYTAFRSAERVNDFETLPVRI
jgi:hypothetical protein